MANETSQQSVTANPIAINNKDLRELRRKSIQANSNHRQILEHLNDDDADDFLSNDHDDDGTEVEDFFDRQIRDSRPTILLDELYITKSFRKKRKESLVLQARGSIKSFFQWKKDTNNLDESLPTPEQMSWISFSEELNKLHQWDAERDNTHLRHKGLFWCLNFSLVVMLVFGIVELVNMNSDSDILSFFQNKKKETTLLDSIHSHHNHENSKISVNSHSSTDENVTLGSNILDSTVASAAAAATSTMSSVIDATTETKPTTTMMNTTIDNESSLVQIDDEKLDIIKKTCAITNIMSTADGYLDCRDLCLEIGCCVQRNDGEKVRLICHDDGSTDDVRSACTPFLSLLI